MSQAALPHVERAERRPLGATIWFLWMVAMWAAFFVLLFADREDPRARALRTLRRSFVKRGG
jgi:hypothetical protein